MTAVDTLPGESNAQIISSIINLVCPQCGGRMSEFQCEGRCRRNWLAEWEWANQATRNPGSWLGPEPQPQAPKRNTENYGLCVFSWSRQPAGRVRRHGR